MGNDVALLENTSFTDGEHPHYGEMIFVVITEENKEDQILAFCKEFFHHNLSELGVRPQSDLMANLDDLTDILNSFPCPFTIVQEMYHIDRTFRDSYYTYFSNQHFFVKRYSRRLSFFKGIFNQEQFFSTIKGDQKDDPICNAFMGSCVVNPLAAGAIGRTLIDPNYILKSSEKPVYMRLSDFVTHVYGKRLVVRAFPYRMQDEETMRCAEVTLLNLLEFFSNSFNDYRTVVPSEILRVEQKHHHERVLPSRGITYPMLTKILSDFGFSPRLYNQMSIDKSSLSQVSKLDELRRWLHYYIESGIPVALNLLPLSDSGSGHSMVCIGHGDYNPTLLKDAQKKKWVSWEHRETCHPIINSADLYDTYIVVDDNQPVYQKRDFRKLSLYPDMQLENIAVPLYKRMFLDAPDAAAIVLPLLHHEQYGIDVWTDFLSPQEDVVIRLFMSSSHSLKDFRSKTFTSEYAKEVYALTPMPRFVWVCELYRVCDYASLQAFGEIVLDATSAPIRGQGHRSLILMYYPGVICYRFPEQPEVDFDRMVELDNDGLFPGFSDNLDYIR